MENCRSKNTSSPASGDKFSFPATIPDSDQFEFGPVTSPSSPKSPADHLFFNGKLLPHVFPIHTPNNSNYSYSRSTSRTSSISSKDYSLMSSRSNSTNSRSSNCSSARTSTSTICSDASSDLQRRMSSSSKVNNRNNNNVIRPPVAQYNHQHGSSQRWRLIAAAPVLSHQGSRSRNKVDQILERNGSKKSDGAKSWFGKRILKSFVYACKECHAIKT